MKRTLLYLPALVMLSLLFWSSCKKDLVTHGSASAVSTISTGGYAFDFITVDKSGNIYGLHHNIAGDTIYRITAGGAKTLFYTPAATTVNDTLQHHPMDCLTTDSTGNIYT